MNYNDANDDRRWVRWVVLVLAGLGSAVLYMRVVALAQLLPSAEPTYGSEVFPWLRPLTQQSLLALQKQNPALDFVPQYLECCAGLFVLYCAMIWAAGRVRDGRFTMCAGILAAAFSAILLVGSRAMLSSDCYAYAWYGRILAVYHANANVPAPAAAMSDPFLLHGWYHFTISVYGPLWTVISAIIVTLTHGGIGWTIFLFRFVEVGAVLKCGWFIHGILKKIRPEWAARGMVLFLWNPVVLIESAMGGHNDACMMALALFAVWLHVRGWKPGAAAALALSALVKVITWPLVALYILAMLRQAPGWKERARLLTTSGLAVGSAIVISLVVARMPPGGLIARTAGTADFFENNYHQLVFRELRQMFGEHANTLDAPMDFHTWWVAASAGGILREDISATSPDVQDLQPGEPMLALSAKDSRDWLRVYDPVARRIGFVDWYHIYPIDEPAIAQTDPVVRKISMSPRDWPTVVRANLWIRLATWSVFLAFSLLAALQVRDFDSFIRWSTLFFLVALMTVMTRLWPWYILWPLAFGALRPGAPATLLAVLFSAGQLVVYALLACCNTQMNWCYEYRSLFTVVLPFVVFAVIECSRMAWREMHPEVEAK